MPGNKPNILFLMSDEHRRDILGYAGDPIVRTPRLDALAEIGVVFTQAYTPSPICIPGRQAMMSGQLPRTCGVESFGQDLAPGYMTFARRLAQYGWHTVAAGKLHHTGPDQMQGWMQRLGSEIRMADHRIEDRDEDSFAPYAETFRRHKWSDTKEVLRAGVGRPPSHVADEYALQGTLNFIRDHFTDPYFDRSRPERPVLLKVSFNQPHYPYQTDQGKFEYYLNRVRPYLDEPVFDHPFLSQRQVDVGTDVTERDIQRATAAYYGMIETIDEYYGVVLDALEAAGQDLDEWIIIYTSDHGEMLGQHGIWEKQKFFEASVGVPLFIRWPVGFGSEGHTVTENVNLCDLFATLCDFTGVPTPDGLDSRSLVPLCQGDTTNWSGESVSQFGGRNLMIKQGDLKYQYYGPDMPEVLFDLGKDPQERVNLIEDPEYTDACQRFRYRCGELGFGSNAYPDYINAGYA
ncbi:MAG: sulfatase-like hydrolase/transferase [Caldilineaceae bacterium SB0661_bin_34]|nr:sulfatase-like hydrolase/transferase [Caldilineaceae bacterium SB0661_bin_34]